MKDLVVKYLYISNSKCIVTTFWHACYGSKQHNQGSIRQEYSCNTSVIVSCVFLWFSWSLFAGCIVFKLVKLHKRIYWCMLLAVISYQRCIFQKGKEGQMKIRKHLLEIRDNLILCKLSSSFSHFSAHCCYLLSHCCQQRSEGDFKICDIQEEFNWFEKNLDISVYIFLGRLGVISALHPVDGHLLSDTTETMWRLMNRRRLVGDVWVISNLKKRNLINSIFRSWKFKY